MEVLTGLAGVSSRTCRLPAPQIDAEAATAWSSSGRLSTIMILLIRTTTMSLQLQRGEKIQCRNGGKYMTIRDLKPVRKLISTDAISLCYQIVYCCYLFPETFNKVGEVNGGGGLTLY